MTTGAPGTPAEVINSGDENNAVFDFVIPRGADGAAGTLEVLTATDATSQTPGADSALTFSDTPLVSGSSISHQDGSAEVVISQPGVYRATFNATAAIDAGTAIPGSVQARLNLDGVQVAGAIARHTFTASNEEATIFFDVPFAVRTTPATLEVVVSDPGYTFTDSALTVIRLGDTSTVRTA